MSHAMVAWASQQLRKINGKDDLTLLEFCMSLTDASEIRQYLAAYLGSTPEVRSGSGGSSLVVGWVGTLQPVSSSRYLSDLEHQVGAHTRSIELRIVGVCATPMGVLYPVLGG